MKTAKFLIGVFIFFSLADTLKAQDQVDALRFSQKFFQGDARSAGAGNAFGAIGANFLSTDINPAGLAFYRSNEFAFSLGFSNLTSKATYLGQTTQLQRANFNIPDFDFVLSKVNRVNGKDVTDGWVGHSFGMGIIRTNNFNINTTFQGTNTTSSVLNYYAESIKGISPSKLSLNSPGGLAWDTYLLNYDEGSQTYIPVLKDSLPKLFQENSIKSRGSAYDINFSYAANYSNKVYIGGTLAIPTFGYHEQRILSEVNRNTGMYNSSDYERDLDLSGIGFKADFGLIYKPVDFLRIGGSIQTPAFYRVSANYTQQMNSSLDTFSGSSSSEGNIFYNLNTPFRATASLGLVFGKFGFIDVDYDYVNYSLAYLNSDVYSYVNENNRISNIYGPSNNIRVGGELKFDIFALRAGYGMYGSPYTSTAKPANGDGSSTVLSFGVGIRENDYFFDVGYQMFQTKEFYLPYTLQSTPVEGAVEKLNRNNLLFTFGLKF